MKHEIENHWGDVHFNGKGNKYFSDGNLEFEGEYLNGKKWTGKGYDKKNISYEIKNEKEYIKEYYDVDTLKFEGEYLNGEKSGKVKVYNNKNNFF